MAESYVPTLIKELNRHGIKDWAVDTTGKHNKLRFVWGDKVPMLVFPKTPSDSQRGLLNCLSDLRKCLGTKRVTHKSPNRGNHHTPAATPPPACPHLTIRPDPFMALSGLKDKLMQPKEPVRCPTLSLARISEMLSCEPRLSA